MDSIPPYYIQAILSGDRHSVLSDSVKEQQETNRLLRETNRLLRENNKLLLLLSKNK